MIDIKTSCRNKEITQKELAKKVGISEQAISLIALGINQPRVSTAKKIASVLDIDWVKFYERS